MDFSQVALNHGLTFLVWVSGIILIVVAVFLIKLLMDLSVLVKNVNETSVMLNSELKPTINELNQTLHSINTIVKNTDKNVDSFKGAVERTFGKTKALTGTIFSGLVKGFNVAWKMFAKK